MEETKLILADPIHIRMASDGRGEFPDTYYVTEKGLEVIKKYLNNIKDNNE